jgi:YVTN family beta-propeller protein
VGECVKPGSSGNWKVASNESSGRTRVLACVALACFGVSCPCEGQIEATAYITDELSKNVSVVDTSTNTVIGAPVGVGKAPMGVTPDDKFAYVVNGFGPLSGSPLLRGRVPVIKLSCVLREGNE